MVEQGGQSGERQLEWLEQAGHKGCFDKQSAMATEYRVASQTRSRPKPVTPAS